MRGEGARGLRMQLIMQRRELLIFRKYLGEYMRASVVRLSGCAGNVSAACANVEGVKLIVAQWTCNHSMRKCALWRIKTHRGRSNLQASTRSVVVLLLKTACRPYRNSPFYPYYLRDGRVNLVVAAGRHRQVSRFAFRAIVVAICHRAELDIPQSPLHPSARLVAAAAGSVKRRALKSHSQLSPRSSARVRRSCHARVP